MFNVEKLPMHNVQMHADALYGFTYVRAIIRSLNIVDYLPVQTQKNSITSACTCHVGFRNILHIDMVLSNMNVISYWVGKLCFVCFLFHSLRPINNLSVIKGTGWTSTKLGFMFLLKDTTQWRRRDSNPRSLELCNTISSGIRFETRCVAC